MSRFSKSNRKGPFKNLNRHLHVEALEERSLMTCNVISGYVYYDVNNNGLYEPALNETPIANSTIELRDANNVVVGSTTTNAVGYYSFEDDITQPATDETLTKVVTFDPTRTNFNLSGVLDQFDPALGELESIEIQHTGSITSEISVENFSDVSESDIAGTVSGTLTLTGPGGLNNVLNISANAGSYHAGIYDGNTDFGGTSGKNFGAQTANGTGSVTLTGAAMDAFKGTGTVTLTEAGIATSDANGGGNLDVRIRSTGKSTVTVIYHYKERPCLAPGDYTIVQTQQPPTFIDGKEAKDGDVIPNSNTTDLIHVSLNGVDLPNNNFGEVKKTQLSGHVWHDANNDGVRDASEDPIAGVTITLVGPGGPQTRITDAAGYYEFLDLEAGTYTVKETQPANYLDGKDKEGTKGGTVVNNALEDQIQAITLVAGDNSQNNDFGEIKPASIAGHVWYDADDDGIRDPGELPIPGATVTLTGFDDKGPINKSMPTNAAGEYKFDNLRPGTYALHETQPAGYSDGKDSIGTPGGVSSNDAFDNIVLPVGFDGVNNDFGEIKSDTPDTPGPKDQSINGTLPFISKTQQTTGGNTSNISPVLRGQMAFTVGLGVTLLGRQMDLLEVYSAVQQLSAGTTRQAFVQNMWASNAHRANQATQLYQEILNRPPTAQEKAATIAQLKAGSTELQIRETLYVSQEYGALHNTQEALAVALSRDILNITPGTTSTQSLIQAMDTQPLSTVVHNLLMSDASLANQIDTTYRQTVRRAPTATEIQLYTPQIQAGTLTLDTLAQRLLSSQEFYTLTYNRIH